ncbi:integration host factor subunit beta [Methylobacterium mesophilicum SR1.6/6]|uniref:Integration host factor subunit beta n=1 Tax=Methylobacterium mesophilicum SR1.6/6 TaxID=908290 RepID=A0A6B9FNV7_9HYPH|nr:HU family DNA-binding protein [Methylobacterium mesophilicum]QGY03549.1 integration host factor subunit beta [Methylobacterium mesophilicum SR1.6/6]
MIRSELITRIAKQNPHLYAKDVEAVVSVILAQIAAALTSGDRVELRDFGSFATKELQGRTARNPKTGAVVSVETKLSIAFKPGKAMRVRLNRPTTRGDGDPSQPKHIID